MTTAPAPKDKTINKIRFQETTVTVMDTTMAPAPSSTTTTNNKTPEASTMIENTKTVPSPSSYTGQKTTTMTEPGLLMTTNMMVPAPLYKATNIYTNIYIMPSIGTAKEKGLLMESEG